MYGSADIGLETCKITKLFDNFFAILILLIRNDMSVSSFFMYLWLLSDSQVNGLYLFLVNFGSLGGLLILGLGIDDGGFHIQVLVHVVPCKRV